MPAITWYAKSSDLRPRYRGPVGLEAALNVIDDYFARLKLPYEAAETALAETMFGFSRASNDFIEICLHAPGEISLTVELPSSPIGGLLAKIRGSFRRERTLDSLDSLRRHVTAYFTLTPQQFKAHVKAEARPSSSQRSSRPTTR